MYAQIRDSNGQFGSQLPIIEESLAHLDPVQMANSLQIQALRGQLDVITGQINLIDQSVRAVLQGQQSDRIGLYHSGLSLYLESRVIVSNNLKSTITAQSLSALSESTFQLAAVMESDIEYLLNGEYKIAKGKNVELIDERMQKINHSFAFIHQATMLRAGIYCNLGELSAMSTVLDEYSRFIDNTVVNNVDLLVQWDKTDSGSEEGVWKSRAKLKLEMSDLAKQLNDPDKTLFLGILKEDMK